MTIQEYIDRQIHAAIDIAAVDRIYDDMDDLYAAYEKDSPAWDVFIVANDIDIKSAYGMAALEAWLKDMRED